MSEDIAAIKIFPGFSPNTLKEMLNGTNIKGIVLEGIFSLYFTKFPTAFGAGNIPGKKDLIRVLEDAVKANIVVVIISQVHKGTVNVDLYATGHVFKTIGVVPGNDLTCEGIAKQ